MIIQKDYLIIVLDKLEIKTTIIKKQKKIRRFVQGPYF
jgi:hypothetical protein